METVAQDSRPPATAQPKPKRKHKQVKPQLLTRKSLDQRSNAAKLFDHLVTHIQADLGGRDQLSTVELSLIEGFVGATVVMNDLNTRLALGQKIDLAEHAAAVSAMVRVAAKIGLSRRSRIVSGLVEARPEPGAVSSLRERLSVEEPA